MRRLNYKPLPQPPREGIWLLGEENGKLNRRNNLGVLFQRFKASEEPLDIPIVLKGQYLRAYELLEDAFAASLNPIIVGPPGVGKSLLARKFAYDTRRDYFEVFFDELMSPTYLVGSYNPALLLHKGYAPEAFEPGPLLMAMLEGGIFMAQEINRASEFCQNSLLEPLEERTYNIPKLGRIKADVNFSLIATANPQELVGVHRISEALRDRLHVWIELNYPDKEVELEIVRANSPEYRLSDEVLDKIHTILKATRESKEVSRPASVRAGISMARLAARYEERGKLGDGVLLDIAQRVLLGAIKTRVGASPEEVIRRLVEGALGWKG